MKPVCIRQAKRDDLIDLEWDGEYTHFRRLYADTFTMMEQGKAIIWIAEADGAGLIGQCFVSLKGNRPELADGLIRAYVYGFRVRPEYRNQGIGARIMYILEEDLWKRGFRQVTLNVGKDNNDARRFYDRLGYNIIGDDPGRWSYIDDKGKRRDMLEPAWRMLKNLG
ncbi:MAG TPA: GNAT family N-acetyltransferase [Anaerolineales bacterium]|nr:GNAT family N-acetyltransferase [Anaerolineales bacterium]